MEKETDLGNAIGNNIIIFIANKEGHSEKNVVKVLSVDKGKNQMTYEYITGESKGKVKTGEYKLGNSFLVSDEDTLLKMLMII